MIEGKNRIAYTNVIVGEVWVCSGKSNMQWSVQALYNPFPEIDGDEVETPVAVWIILCEISTTRLGCWRVRSGRMIGLGLRWGNGEGSKRISDPY